MEAATFQREFLNSSIGGSHENNYFTRGDRMTLQRTFIMVKPDGVNDA